MLKKNPNKNKHSIATKNKITDFEIVDSKNSSTTYVYALWIALLVLDSNRRLGVWLPPWRWHIISILLIAGRGKSVDTCGLDDVFSPDDLCSQKTKNSVLIYIFSYMYTFFIRILAIGRIYTYTGSVVQHWWSCTPSQSIRLFWGSARFLCWMSLVVFFGFNNCAKLYDNKNNTRMLVTIGIRFKQHFHTRHFAFCNLSPPRMFCPWANYLSVPVRFRCG